MGIIDIRDHTLTKLGACHLRMAREKPRNQGVVSLSETMRQEMHWHLSQTTPDQIRAVIEEKVLAELAQDGKPHPTQKQIRRALHPQARKLM